MKQVVLFGGSFNPIHLGHLALAKAVLDQQMAEEVWFMVSPQNPLKPQEGLLDEQLRLKLVRKAIEDYSRLYASDFEFSLSRPSYTWQTLEALEKTYPHYRFSLLIGADNWACFTRWARWQDLLFHYDFIVYPRAGFPLSTSLPPRVHRLEAPRHEVSSTEIRKAIAQGQDVTNLLPKAIVEDCLCLYAAK